jgi:surfactin family lipopeptide synthetase C
MKAADLEDLYELTPLQQGLLFHCLYAPDEGVYVEQAYLTLHGEIRRDEFWAAWQKVYDRHPALRSTYHWDGVAAAVQAVHRRVPIEHDERDWRDVPADQAEERLRDFLAEERQRGLDLQQPPLMRLTLFRVAEDRFYFAMRISHLIMDGWSVGIILQEFIATYRALYHGRSPALGRPGLFREYVGWWRRQDRDAVERYWRDRLAGYQLPEPLDLGPVGAVPEDGVPYDRTDLTLADIADDLRQFCRTNQLTLHTVIQGAWMLVLSRCSGRDDVVAGATMAHRPDDVAGVQAIVGPMVVTLPIRIPVTDEIPLREWLGRIQDAIVAAREHAGAPLTDIRGWSGQPANTDLFESIVSFENVPLPSLEFPDEHLALTDYVFDGRPQYPLSFVVLPGDHLPLRLVFDRRRFSPDSARRMLARVRATLVDILARPDRPLGEVDVLPADEHARLTELHQIRHTHPVDACLPDLVRGHAAARPDAVALSGDGETLTYRELDQQAGRLARHLREVGVRPGDRVALYAGRSPRTVMAMVAILRAGAAMVPLDPQHPTHRLSFIIADAGVRTLVTENELVDRFDDVEALTVVRLDTAWPAVPAPSDDGADLPQDSDLDPDDCAYLVYTSGSTGTPKGMLMTHRNALRLVWAMDHQLAVTADDVWTCLHTFAFDASVWEIWGALAHGSRLVIGATETARLAEATYQLLVREQVTVLLLTPRALEQLIQIDGEEGDLRLRYVLVGADRVEPTALYPWFARHGDRVPVFNVYGPTETTVFCTSHRITTAEAGGTHAPSNIGRPMCDMAMYLLDPAGRPVPFGATGEICIAGAGVGLGYLNRPELTGERFVPDPYRPGELIYRSGDLGRYDEAGEVEYLGRGDNQVKIRGYRVELGEIEYVLREHPAVHNAAVVLRGDNGPAAAELVAYLVSTGGPVDEAPLRGFLRDRLPPYMEPAHFVTLDRIPLNANGKLDARVLPAPGARQGSARVEPPVGEVERRLAEVIAATLNLEEVGRNDNLLDLGLHSLVATGLVGRIRDEWRVPIALRTLFDTPTVAALAKIIESGGEGPAATAAPGRVNLAAEAVLPDDIRPDGVPPAPPAAAVLLTGGTGLLGSALLGRLLAGTGHTVHCLVRAATPAEGLARLRDVLAADGTWRDGYADRIVPVIGDLGRPALGLSPEAFTTLADQVQEVYHCGALVNFVQPYRRLQASNVEGTVEVLRLAVTGSVKRVHYISTGAVLGQLRDGDGADPVMREERLTPTPPRLSGGYAESKWVAERLVSIAGDRGVPVTICRSGRVTGESATGRWRPGDATAEMLRACAHLGAVPSFDGEVDMTPIDYVSAAVVALASRDDTTDAVYHLTNPVPVSIAQIADGLVAAGYEARTVEVPRWYADVVRLSRTAPGDWSAALAVLGQWVHSYTAGLREPRYDPSKAVRLLAGELDCPVVDATMIARYLRHFQSLGYVPEPALAAKAP